MRKSKEELRQLEWAKMRQNEILRKSQAQKAQSSGGVSSQWGKVTSESRLIDNGHYMKSSERATLDYYRDQVKKTKKENGTKIVLVKKV